MITNQNESQIIPGPILHPILTDARKIAPNQLFIMYDQPTDLASATTISNYWIRNNLVNPADIAGVGMGEALTMGNAIRPEIRMITPVDNSKKRFVITFRVNSMSGVLYVVLPCFVNFEAETGYRGGRTGVPSVEICSTNITNF